jgi:diguanylate cyclase (GGDEF)-like protein
MASPSVTTTPRESERHTARIGAEIAGVRPSAFALLSLLTLWAIGYEAACTVLPSLSTSIVFKPLSDDAAFALAGLLLIVRGARRERGWLLIGLGSLCWAAGDVYWSLVLANLSSPPVPSWADAGYLSFCPLAFAGIFMLVRSRASGAARTLVIDGLAAALATGALSAAIVVEPVLHNASGGALGIATNLAYPLADLLLLGLIVAATALADWRLNRTLLLLGASVISFWVADSLYLVHVATNSYQDHAWYNPLWYLSPVLAAWAAWLPGRPRAVDERADSARGITMLLGFAMLALGTLVWSSFASVGAISIGLAAASLLVIMGRLVITWLDNVRLLRSSQHEAITDSLTGLRNRRALSAELAVALARGPMAPPLTLVLFDLDGFKHYNDNFGHPAGDALLQRLGGSLVTYLGHRGTAYRMGGDEFCALIDVDPLDAEEMVIGAASSLHEHGEGFAIGCSYGSVLLPTEATLPEDALRTADRRMYARKQQSRVSASTQSRDVLLSALAERNPELGAHLRDVADLAAATGMRLGLPLEEVEQIRQAAELHDVGKVAIPDAILSKPSGLDEDEWAFMRRHTLVGERIINAAPALRRTATLVRSSHECYDGSGYPDQLTADQIPLGSRIIAVCDAFDAMTTDRPYRSAVDDGAALAELRRCAGSQFDPIVVGCFAEALAQGRTLRVSAA